MDENGREVECPSSEESVEDLNEEGNVDESESSGDEKDGKRKKDKRGGKKTKARKGKGRKDGRDGDEDEDEKKGGKGGKGKKKGACKWAEIVEPKGWGPFDSCTQEEGERPTAGTRVCANGIVDSSVPCFRQKCNMDGTGEEATIECDFSTLEKKW